MEPIRITRLAVPPVQALSLESIAEKQFSYFLIKAYVVGTQKNRLNETVPLSTQNLCSRDLAMIIRSSEYSSSHGQPV